MSFPRSLLILTVITIAISFSFEANALVIHRRSSQFRSYRPSYIRLHHGGEDHDHQRQKKINVPVAQSQVGFSRNKKQSILYNRNTSTSLFYMNNGDANVDVKVKDNETAFILRANETFHERTSMAKPTSTKMTTIPMYDKSLSELSSQLQLPMAMPPPASSSASTLIQLGTFGDIMSQSNNDADLLFRDGLVTSESYSLEDIYKISNPLDRIALTANGNLQRLFSSYYDAPVVVEVVHCTRQHQHQHQLNHDQQLSLHDDENQTCAVWDRRVLLKVFNHTFCTADSIVVVHSKEVEDLVESGKVGIGQIFRHFNILPQFNLLKAGPTPTGGIWRFYRLESHLVTCSIREVFCNGVWDLSPSHVDNESKE